MHIRVSSREVSVDKENTANLVFEQVVYPMPGYANNYYDGVSFRRRKRYVEKRVFGGGDGWGRRGSLTESWDDRAGTIPVKEFDLLRARVKAALKYPSQVAREHELRSIVDEVLKSSEPLDG